MRVELLMVMALACAVSVAAADDGWDFTVGAGVYGSTVYSGSDDYYLAPVPLLEASYAKGGLAYSLSLLNGLGVMYCNEKNGLSGSINLTYGEERDSEEYSVLGVQRDHSGRTKRLLRGTPTVSTQAIAKAMLGYMTAIGSFGGSIEYHPTTVEENRDGRKDSNYQGMIYSLTYAKEFPVTTQLSVSAMLGVEFMNQDYADAWYTVRHQTDELDTFEAQGGLRDAMLSLQVTRMFSEQFGASLLGKGTLLLKDAGRSPYTVERFQPTAMLYTFYRF